MAVTLRVNGGSTLSLGSGATTPAEQQLSSIEILTDTPTTDVATYGGSTVVTGQAKRTLHLVGYQDWAATGSVCQFLEDNQNTWQAFSYDQFGGGTASATNPIVSGELLCAPPKRGGVIDTPEDFDLTLGIRGYTVEVGP